MLTSEMIKHYVGHHLEMIFFFLRENFGNEFDCLCLVRHTNNVDEFIEIGTHVPQLSDGNYLDYFMHGLLPSVYA